MSEQQLQISCPTRLCPNNGSDLEIYNLQDALYFNGTAISIIAQCPTNYYCRPGLFPYVFTYPPGTFTIPIPPIGTGFPIVLSYSGCESELNTILPATATAAQVQAAADILIAEAAAQQARCDAITLVGGTSLPRAITFSDIEEYTCVDAVFTAVVVASASPSGAPYAMAISGKPSWMTATVNGAGTQITLTGTPTTIGPVSFTLAATGSNSSGTRNYTLNVVGISTATPLAAGQVSVAYSQTLAAASIPGVLVWAVTVGALPAGLVLDTATGEIYGTPTTGETANFTVSATGTDIGCEKEFSITVAATPPYDCLGNPDELQNAVWAEINPVGACKLFTITAGAGTFTYTCDNAGPCLNTNFGGIGTTICNPGDAYDVTLTIVWASSGNAAGTFNVQFTLTSIDLLFNVHTDSVNGSMLTDLPNPVVLTVQLNAQQISTLELGVVSSTTGGAPSYTIAGTIAVSPLTPP